MSRNNALRPSRDICGVGINVLGKKARAMAGLPQTGNADTHTEHSQEGIQGSLCIWESLCSTVALSWELYGIVRYSVRTRL